MRAKPRSLIIDRWPLSPGHCPLLTLCLLFLTLGTGCRVIRGVANVPGQTVRAVTPGKQNKDAVDPVEAQQTLLRFADEFSTRMILGVDQLRRGPNALDRAEVLQWKIALGTETCAIASGPNAVANLLDMTVFVTVIRAALEEHWQPKVFGESARPMLESCRDAETNIWQFTGRVFKPEQQAELRTAIAAWRRQNPLPESVLAARAVGFAAQVAQANQADPTKAGSVFSLLNVDPLAGMDPAVREIAQTRLFARARSLRDPDDAAIAAVADGASERQRGGDARRAAVGDELHTDCGLRRTLRRHRRKAARAAHHRATGNPESA